MKGKQIGTSFNLPPLNHKSTNLFPKQIWNVPASVRSKSQQEHEPPEHKYSSHPGLVSRDAKSLRQKVRTRRQQDVEPREFGDGSERPVHRRQCVVSLSQFGRNPGKHMNAEGRNHHHRNYSEVQKNDDGLAPGVVPIAPLAGKPCAHQQTYSHREFEKENYVGSERSGGIKECLEQWIVSTQSADCLAFLFRWESRVAEWAELILSTGREMLRSHIV